MELTGFSFVGARRGTVGGMPFHAVDPSSMETLDPPYFAAAPSEIDRAAQLAHEAFPIYGRITGKKRARFLRSIAEEMEGITDDIVERGMMETGLPEGRLRGETARTTGQLRMFATLVEEGSWVDARIDSAQPDRHPLPKPDIRSMLRPLGPAAVFCASNFPLAFSVAGGDTASALASGCPVVVKAHPSHPGLAELAGAAIRSAVGKAGLPEGVFSLVFDDGHEAGLRLVRHPLIKAVGFTGSRAGGLALMDAAASRPEPIPVYAEMSAVNPVVMLSGALRARGEDLAKELFTSLTLGAGQFCTNPGVVFIAGETPHAFLDQLKGLVWSSQPCVMLNQGIAETCRKKSSGLEHIPGVRLLARGGEVPDNSRSIPTVHLTDVAHFLEEKRLHEEIFGPVTLLVSGTVEEITDAISRMEGQLTATLHASPQELEEHLPLIHAMEARAGRVLLNGFPTGVEVCSSIVHGGPFPATSDGRSSSVGTMAITRFCRPVSWQAFPDAVLPPELRDGNPCHLHRTIDGVRSAG